MAGAKFIIIFKGKVYKWEYYGNYYLDGFGLKLITQLTSKPIQEILDFISGLPEDFTQDYELSGNLFKLTALGSELGSDSDEAYEMLYSYTIDFDTLVLSIWCKNTRIGDIIKITNISEMTYHLKELINLEKKLIQ